MATTCNTCALLRDGTLNDIEQVTGMGRMVAVMESPLRLLVASIRQTENLVKLAERGLNSLTILLPLILDLLENELTQMEVDSFEAAVR